MRKASALFLIAGNFGLNNTASICILKPASYEQK